MILIIKKTSTTNHNVAKLDRMIVVHALWKNSKPASFFNNYPHLIPDFNPVAAQKEICVFKNNTWNVDYVCGRQCKVIFTGDGKLDPTRYDKEVSKKAAEVIAELNNL